MTDLEMTLHVFEMMEIAYYCDKRPDGGWYVETADGCGNACFEKDGKLQKNY